MDAFTTSTDGGKEASETGSAACRLREAAKQCRIVREGADRPEVKASLDENIASLENLAIQLEDGGGSEGGR